MKPALAFVAATPVAAAAASRPPLRAAEPTARTYAELSRAPRSRQWLLVGIAVLHLLGFWGLSQVQNLRRAVARNAPVVVRLIAPAEPVRPPPPAQVALPEFKAPATTLVEPPLIAVAAAPAPAPVVAALPPPPPVQQAPVQSVAVAVVPVAPAPTPSIKQVPASAVRYLKEPRMTVPLMSKRLRESGIVHVRVVVDVRGQPREITLARSSGYARLDEQALQDMRSARFVPYTENGQPVEMEVIAPMSYEVDR